MSNNIQPLDLSTESLREKLIRLGWVDNFNADTLVRLIEKHYAEKAESDSSSLPA